MCDAMSGPDPVCNLLILTASWFSLSPIILCTSAICIDWPMRGLICHNWPISRLESWWCMLGKRSWHHTESWLTSSCRHREISEVKLRLPQLDASLNRQYGVRRRVTAAGRSSFPPWWKSDVFSYVESCPGSASSRGWPPEVNLRGVKISRGWAVSLPCQQEIPSKNHHKIRFSSNKEQKVTPRTPSWVCCLNQSQC